MGFNQKEFRAPENPNSKKQGETVADLEFGSDFKVADVKFKKQEQPSLTPEQKAQSVQAQAQQAEAALENVQKLMTKESSTAADTLDGPPPAELPEAPAPIVDREKTTAIDQTIEGAPPAELLEAPAPIVDRKKTTVMAQTLEGAPPAELLQAPAPTPEAPPKKRRKKRQRSYKKVIDAELKRIKGIKDDVKWQDSIQVLRNTVPVMAKRFNLPKKMGAQFKDRWLLKSILSGKGASGQVFEGHDLNLGQDAVVKVLRRENPNAPIKKTKKERFKREAQILARLNSPHIVQVYDANWSKDGIWFAMEKVEGGDLEDKMKNESMTAEESVDIALQIAQGLKVGHEDPEKIVHRDLKPANVLYNEKTGKYQLADFGVAKLLKVEEEKAQWLQGLVVNAYLGNETEASKNADSRLRAKVGGIVDSLREIPGLVESFMNGIKNVSKDKEDGVFGDEHKQSVNQFIQQYREAVADAELDEDFNELADREKTADQQWVIRQALMLARKKWGAKKIKSDQSARLAKQLPGEAPYTFNNKQVSPELKERISLLSEMVKSNPDLKKLLEENPEEFPLKFVDIENEIEAIADSLPSTDLMLTRVGALQGTPLYMSPEQITGGITDEKTDIWALGVMMYEMIKKENPFLEESMIEIMRAVNGVDPDMEGIPTEVAEVISAMISKDKNDRPDVNEVIAALQKIAQQKPKLSKVGGRLPVQKKAA